MRFPFSGNPAADSRRTGFGRSVPAEVFTGSAPKAGFLENGNGWLPLRLWRRVPVRHILRGAVSGQFRPSAHFPQPTLRSGPFFGDGRKRHEPLSLHFPFEIVRHSCTAFRFSKKIFVPFMEINLRFESGLKRGLAALPRTLHRRPALFFAGNTLGDRLPHFKPNSRSGAQTKKARAMRAQKKRRTSTKRAF